MSMDISRMKTETIKREGEKIARRLVVLDKKRHLLRQEYELIANTIARLKQIYDNIREEVIARKARAIPENKDLDTPG